MSNVKHASCIIFYSLCILLNILSCHSYANEKYKEYKVSTTCGHIGVSVIGECSDETVSGFDFCISQNIIFSNKENNISFDACSYVMPGEKCKSISGQILFLLDRFKCVRCNNKNYILARYVNGGNCDECERNVLINMGGGVELGWMEYRKKLKEFCFDKLDYQSGQWIIFP